MKHMRTAATLLAATAALSACSRKSRDATAMPGMEQQGSAPTVPDTLTMSAAQVRHGNVTWQIAALGTVAQAPQAATVPGEIVPNEDRTARLGAPARGRVMSVSVREGDRVTAGQPLVTMQSPDAGAAQADVAKAAAEVTSRRAQAEYAATARARAERLLALKAIPRQDYDRAVSDDEAARAALTQAEAEAHRAQATADQLSVAVDANGLIVLRSSQDGVVLSRTATPGAVLEAGAPLVVVTDPHRLWLSIHAPEAMSTLFHRGDPLRFVLTALPSDTLAARVITVGAGLEPDTRTLSVRADVPRDDRIRPEMLATVFVAGDMRDSLPLIPDDAVQLVQGKPNVFLARHKENGDVMLTHREVTLGARANGRVAVTSGLKSGEVIIVTGAFAVKALFENNLMPHGEM